MELYDLLIFNHTHCGVRVIKRIHFQLKQDLFTAALRWLHAARIQDTEKRSTAYKNQPWKTEKSKYETKI